MKDLLLHKKDSSNHPLSFAIKQASNKYSCIIENKSTIPNKLPAKTLKLNLINKEDINEHLITVNFHILKMKYLCILFKAFGITTDEGIKTILLDIDSNINLELYKILMYYK